MKTKSNSTRWYKSFDEQVEEEFAGIKAANPNGVDSVLMSVARTRVEKRIRQSNRNKGKFENRTMGYAMVGWMVNNGMVEL